jgi:hypothetical protein
MYLCVFETNSLMTSGLRSTIHPERMVLSSASLVQNERGFFIYQRFFYRNFLFHTLKNKVVFDNQKSAHEQTKHSSYLNSAESDINILPIINKRAHLCLAQLYSTLATINSMIFFAVVILLKS